MSQPPSFPPAKKNAIPIGSPLRNNTNSGSTSEDVAKNPDSHLMNPHETSDGHPGAAHQPPTFPPAAESPAAAPVVTADHQIPSYPPAASAHDFAYGQSENTPTDYGSVVPPRFAPAEPAASRTGFPPEFPPSDASGTPGTADNPARLAKTRIRHPWRWFFLTLLALLLVTALVVVFWGLFLVHRVESRIGRVDALSGAAATPGTTWLIAGSDSREGLVNDGTEGERSDSILLVHQAANGQAAMVSLPRDTYTEIPGKGAAKLNAAFAWGGAGLLVQSVEGLTGLTVDHYVQVGMSGVSQIVDAVGGVNLCWDQSFNDRLTGLAWQAGCHDVDGNTALLFSRMRYSDPTGDIGRTKRQRQVISAVLKKALSREVIMSPRRQVALADAGAGALKVDREAKAWDVARLALAMRRASGDGLQGVPPIASVGYNPGHGVGSTVLLDREKAPVFFEKLTAGTLSPADLQPPI